MINNKYLNVQFNNQTMRNYLQKNGPSVETEWPLTIACHMKIFIWLS